MSTEVMVYDRKLEAFRKLDGKPYLVKSAVEFLETVINKESIVLEHGSGSSTVWFAERAKRVIAFEDRRFWLQIVLSELKTRGLDNVVIHFKNDMTAVDPADRFDICLIDGSDWTREAFTEAILPLMNPGGYFAFDNTELKKYVDVLKTIDALGWERQDFKGEGYGRKRHWMTSIWRKPLMKELEANE